MARIFVVEDDASLREELMRLLELQGHTALTGTAFDRIVDDVLAAAPDCVILDLKLPGTGGHTVCRDLRRSSQVPVIMLTSSDSEFDEVLSMNLGADDYVTKPYNPAVLLARIQSVLRRTQRTEPPTRIEHRGVVLDVARGRVEHGGRSVDLTRNELKILHMLDLRAGVERQGHVVEDDLVAVRLARLIHLVDEFRHVVLLCFSGSSLYCLIRRAHGEAGAAAGCRMGPRGL